MERLNCLRCAYRHEDNGNCTAAGGFCTAVPAAHCRLLQEYLGTGLTPEEVPTAVEMAQIYSIIEENKRYRALNVTVDRLKELARADKEGRVVVLPCKVGDTVWAILDGAKYARECKVDFVNIGSVGTTIVFATKDRLREQYGVTAAAFGKTVFLTREEAEQALRKEKVTE